MKGIALGLAAALALSALPAFGQAADRNDIKAAIKAQREDVEQDWPKKEEPALRPYKNIAHGLYALLWHPVRALADGNEKFPGIGSVEIFRGVRRGSVELIQRTTTGMMFSKPQDHTYYSKPNRVIDSDPLLYHAADTVTPMLTGAGAGASGKDAVIFGASIKATQMVTDERPFAEDDEAEEEPSFEKDRVSKAQERYIGKRATVNEKPAGTGNLLKYARNK